MDDRPDSPSSDRPTGGAADVSPPDGRRSSSSRGQTIRALQERAKELDCLYRVDEILSREDLGVEEVFAALTDALPHGLQHRAVCQVRIRWGGRVFTSPGYVETEWKLSAPLQHDPAGNGEIEVSYTADMPDADHGPFLREETRLIQTIAERLSKHLLRQVEEDPEGWRGAVHVLRTTAVGVYERVSRRMIRHLCSQGIEEARQVLVLTGGLPEADGPPTTEADNRPGQKTNHHPEYYLSSQPFELAARYLDGHEIVRLVRMWLSEEHFSTLARTVHDQHSSLSELTKALRQVEERPFADLDLGSNVQRRIVVSLIGRFLTNDPAFISRAKSHLSVADFAALAERMIHPLDSTGRIGGKAAGLMVAARILSKHPDAVKGDFRLKVPRSWYVAADGLAHFLEHNDLDDWVFGQEYKDLEGIRQEYPLLVERFKNARLSPEMMRGLSMALDDFRGRPLIVRSSSLGEDQQGTAFSGKYKSLFLANQGAKKARLGALGDAMAEVYASTFAPDPIEYRREHGLIDFSEEMGILLQEVVGTRTGSYFFPAFSGVALSRNEFRWSPRIKREDGLLRMVPGLGTRAVDRVGDDYPVLMSPGKPGLRASTSVEEKVKYAPRMIDLIDLGAGSFRSMQLAPLLRDPSVNYPAAPWVFSVMENDRLSGFSALTLDPSRQDLVVTFDGLLNRTTFVEQLAAMLRLLEDEMGTPVDLEFACDGKDLYLLQCRAQSQTEDMSPAPIPRDVPAEDVIFRAVRHVSNGAVPDLSHVVYVDPQVYDDLSDFADLRAVGTVIGRLNAALPRQRFILMGPGRWGSRGNIKLGVSVTYSDISHTAVLVEIARQKGDYVPDLSFGTHFFQDLVESSIRYLPLYPDEPGGSLNEAFFASAPNRLAELVPAYGHLAHLIKVIDIGEATGGRVLRIAMNADEDEALGYLTTL